MHVNQGVGLLLLLRSLVYQIVVVHILAKLLRSHPEDIAENELSPVPSRGIGN